MKNIAIILDKLLAIAKDARVWFRIFILVVTGFVGAIAFSRTKVKVEDCSYFINQNQELISALIEIKKDLSATVSTSYTGEGEGIIFAQNIPRTSQGQQIRKTILRIDSILWKLRTDSLKRIKSLKTKT